MKTVEYLERLSDQQRTDLFERLYNQSLQLYAGIITCWYIGNMDNSINYQISAKAAIKG